MSQSSTSHAGGRLGVTVPLDQPLSEHAGVLARLSDAGYSDFWTPETAAFDAFTPLAVAAALLPTTAQLGTGVPSVFTRGPALLAMSAAALAEAAPGRFSLGIGAGSPAIVEGWNGGRFTRPLTRVRDTVRFLRDALAGERIDREFDSFTIRGFRLERPPATPPPVLVAALRPGMLRLAGAEADGVVLNWLSADDVRTVVPYVAEGGEGRTVVARLFVCASTDTERVRTAARRIVAGYLTVPAYEQFQRWLGRDALRPMWDAWARGDRKTAAASVPDAVIDELFIHGTPEQCAAGIARYVDNGVDVPVVKFLGLDPTVDPLESAVATARAVRSAVTP